MSKAAHSYSLQYSKGTSFIALTSTNGMGEPRLCMFVGPGKKAKGEIRIDQVFGTQKQGHGLIGLEIHVIRNLFGFADFKAWDFKPRSQVCA